MRRIIKITEAQLREAEGDAFKYLDVSDDTKPFDGQSTITAQGKLDGDENGEPIFTDRVARQRTPQSWARYRMYGNINKPASAEPKNVVMNMFNEGVSLQGDENGDGIDDMFSDVAKMGKDTEALSDGDKLNNLSVIPDGIDRKTDILINAMKQSNLTPKQIAIVINKLQDSFPEIANNSQFVKKLLRQQVDPNDIRDFD